MPAAGRLFSLGRAGGRARLRAGNKDQVNRRPAPDAGSPGSGPADFHSGCRAGWTIIDRKTKQPRPAHAGDVAFLFRAMTDVGPLRVGAGRPRL